MHDPPARLRAPLQPQQRPALDWNRHFQHCAGLIRDSARPFSPHDPYSHRGSTQSCLEFVGTPGAISEEGALEYTDFGCGGPRSHTGRCHGPPAQGNSHGACSERAARETVLRQEFHFAARQLRPPRPPHQLSLFHRLLCVWAPRVSSCNRRISKTRSRNPRPS